MIKYNALDYFRAIVFQIVYVSNFLVANFFFLLSLAFTSRPKSELRHFFTNIDHRIMKLIVNIEIYGKIQKSPSLIVANHGHSYETVLMAILSKAQVFVVKQSLKWWPILWDSIGVNRDGSDLSALKSIQQRLTKDKESVVIFPQGTRDETLPFSQSIALIARYTNCLVTPVSLNCSHVLNAKKISGLSLFKEGSVLKATIHNPVSYKQVLGNYYYVNSKLSEVSSQKSLYKIQELQIGLEILTLLPTDKSRDRFIELLQDFVNTAVDSRVYFADQDIEQTELLSLLQIPGRSSEEMSRLLAIFIQELHRALLAHEQIALATNKINDAIFTKCVEQIVRNGVKDLLIS